MRVVHRVSIASCSWLIGIVFGCSGTPDVSIGSVTVNLVGQATSGNIYRLRDAVITVRSDGAPDQVFRTEDDPDRTLLSADVAAGDYTATVQPGWRLERISGGTAVPVSAQLASPNPEEFTVAPRQRTTVPLRFRVDAEDVDLAEGYDIVLTVDETPPLLFVTNQDENQGPASVTSYAFDASGDVAPLRTITGPATGLDSPLGITVIGDEIAVGNVNNAVTFYALDADGDTGPTRQIAGPHTGLNIPIQVVASGGELYVSDVTGAIDVFPLDAAGDVTPTRKITIPLLDSVRFLAIDGGEIYATTGSSGLIVVVPTAASGTVTPTRTITAIGDATSCTFGIVIQSGEIFVYDPCRQEIRVYPESAAGAAAPVRTIRSAGVPLDGSRQLALFRDHIYMADLNSASVLVFLSTASGAVTPVRTLSGPHTGLAVSFGVTVH
jgi:hypothetical protein